MATATLQVVNTFTPINAFQPSVSTPVDVPVFSTALPTQYMAQTIVLPAAGVSFTLPVPSSWTVVDALTITNTDLLGFCALTLNAGPFGGAPTMLLAPIGGTFAATVNTSVPAGTTAVTPKTWTLQSCSSAGVLAAGTPTYVYLYMTGH